MSDDENGSLRERLIIALIVAVLSFLGSVGGIYFTSFLEKRQWERKVRVQLARETFSKRTELLQRTIKIFSRTSKLSTYETAGEYSFIEGKDMIRSGEDAFRSLGPILEGVEKSTGMQSELSAVMTMNAIYFGPKTKKAVKTLQDSLESAEVWWKINEATEQQLIDAMALELRYGLNDEEK